MVLYAGTVAESIQSGRPIEIGGQDFDSARYWIANTVGVPGCSFVGDDAFERYEHRLEKRARALMMTHWSKVESLAAALMEHPDRSRTTGARRNSSPTPRR